MGLLATLAIVGLVLALAAVVAWTAVTTRANNVEKSNNVLVPFASAPLTGDEEDPKLVNRDGSPQIACPVGTKINIVGAYYDVYDPYLQCSAEPAVQVQNDCKTNTTGGICAGTATIDGVPGVNVMCGPDGGRGACRLRDATAFLGAKCNGRQECAARVTSEFFGPAPCAFPPGSEEYDQLPAIPGSGEAVQRGYYVHGIYACEPE